MKSYATLVDKMMQAILARDVSAADELFKVNPDFAPPDQLAIYVEGYRLRLLEAVEGVYPALRHYLGNAAFAQHALAFIEATPSRFFNVDQYPIAFAAFLEATLRDGVACELASLESAVHEAYMAKESPPLSFEWLQRQSPEGLIAAPLKLRASARLFTFTTVVNAYLSAQRAGENPEPPLETLNHLIVLRHRNLVQRHALMPAEHMLLSLIEEGRTLGEALEDPRMEAYAQGKHFAAELRQWLARFVQEGYLSPP